MFSMQTSYQIACQETVKYFNLLQKDIQGRIQTMKDQGRNDEVVSVSEYSCHTSGLFLISIYTFFHMQTHFYMFAWGKIDRNK